MALHSTAKLFICFCRDSTVTFTVLTLDVFRFWTILIILFNSSVAVLNKVKCSITASLYSSYVSLWHQNTNKLNKYVFLFDVLAARTEYTDNNVIIMFSMINYVVWPQWQGGCLPCWLLPDRFPAEAALIYTMDEGALHEMAGVTSQFDLLSLMPSYVAGCGRLQLLVPHWAASVDYCK